MTIRQTAILALVAIAMSWSAAKACRVDRSGTPGQDTSAPSAPRTSRLDRELTPAAEVTNKEGLAAAVLIDVSGSMERKVAGAEGRQEPKIDIARRAALNLVTQFAKYAADHPTETVLLGVYEFSERSGHEDARVIVPMGKPDPARAEEALRRIEAEGGTPIGNAMVFGKRALDAAGLSRRHLLLVTDGENTDGFDPEDVAQAIGRRPEAERPSMYFVAFDIEARRFTRVRDAGALLLGASNGQELSSTLDALLRGNILIER